MRRRQFVDWFRATAWREGDDPGGRLRGDSDLDFDTAARRALVPAAVLVPVIDRRDMLTVLFTRRTDDLPEHAGQICFPGGRIESDDASPEDAALRETEEEIGLSRHHVEVLGRLDDYATRSGFSITPVVGMVSPPFALALQAREVAETFEVPLDFLLDSTNHQKHERILAGRDRHFYAMPYEGHFIWGATAGMLINLHQRLGAR
ncbi:MAG: CoA pyrophosphatase [Rhodospirillales bacterium]|jgi:8-oxo-dGTP pyrophosphatase MutT (NUDIX family)|nr:CoA pyrophosphatase [Rhodospirillales bacterium]